jgi:hypothetical protein
MGAGEFDVVGALTTVTETFGRVSIHGVRQEILQAQCEAALILTNGRGRSAPT